MAKRNKQMDKYFRPLISDLYDLGIYFPKSKKSLKIVRSEDRSGINLTYENGCPITTSSEEPFNYFYIYHSYGTPVSL